MKCKVCGETYEPTRYSRDGACEACTEEIEMSRDREIEYIGDDSIWRLI